MIIEPFYGIMKVDKTLRKWSDLHENIKAEILKETGEVISDRAINIVRKDAGKKEVKRLEFIVNNSEMATKIKVFGSFYFNHYKNVLK